MYEEEIHFGKYSLKWFSIQFDIGDFDLWPSDHENQQGSCYPG